MTVKTRAQLKSENASDFPNNTTRLITPAALRGQMDDIVDSALFPGDPLSTGPAGPQGETGITSSSVHYNNAAAVEGATVEGGVNLIETLSYAASTDGGSGIYRRVTGPADIQSLDGAWWELVPQGPIRTAALGVKSDAGNLANDVWSGTDNEPAIKSALYRHVYERKGGAVELPVGDILVGRGIHVGYGTSFKHGVLRGAGMAMTFGNDWPSTNLVWQFTDEPLISVQGGRVMLISDMSISGLNSDYWGQYGFGAGSYNGLAGDDTLLATWMRPTWPAQASSRYAPACAIAVDPRTFPADATYHYRDVDYPAAMGAVTQYSKSPTSRVDIERVSFFGCGVCAVVVHPNKDSDGNGDFVRLKSCHIFGVPIGISVGQTQSRLTSFDSVDLAACHTAITTRLHGKQQGCFAEAWNCHFSGIQLFDLGDTSTSGHITLNFYGEETWRLGDVQITSSSATKLILHNCKITFALQTAPDAVPFSRGVAATMIGGTGSFPLEFNGGYFGSYIGCFVIDHSVGGVTINGTMMEPRATSPTIQEKCFQNATMGGLVFSRLGFAEEMGEIHPQCAIWNLNTGASMGRRMLGERWRSSRVTCTPLWTERHCSSVQGPADEGVFISTNRIRSLDIATLWVAAGSLSITDLLLTGTTHASWGDTQHNLFGPEPGDFMLHDASQTVFVCLTRAVHVCTFKQLNNYKGLAARDTINLATGTFWCANTRYYSPATPIYGIITSGSAVITDAGSVPNGGGTQVATSLDPDIAAGDWLVVDPSLVPYLNQSLTKIAVAGIDEAAKTITLSGNAIGSSTTRVRLGTFIRTPV